MANIPENWRDSVQGIIAAGRTVIEQRRGMTAPQFRAWLSEQTDFSDTSSRRLASVALHPVLSDPANASRLPAEWGKLYEMSFLPDSVLKKKLANGGLLGLTKYEIWQLRNEYPESARSNYGPNFKAKKYRPRVPSLRKTTPHLMVPDGKTAESWVQEGLDLERGGKHIVEAAAAIGISNGTYGKARRILLIAQRTDLNAEDRAFIDAAVADMNEYGTIEPIHARIVPLMTKVWGKRGKHGGFKQPLKVGEASEVRRKEGFMHALTVLEDTCHAATSIEVPYLSEEEISSAINQIGGSRYALWKLSEKLRRSSND